MFRIKLWHRVFALTALATLLALAALLLVQQRNFQSGLLDYVNQLNRERAEGLLPALASEYRDHDSWDRLRRNPVLFRQLLDPESLDQRSRDRPPRPTADGPRRGRDDADGRGHAEVGPPPRWNSLRGPPPVDGSDGDRSSRPRPPADWSPPPPPAGPGGQDKVRARYALYDASGRAVIGPREPWPDSVLLPVRVADREVGTLVFLPCPGWKAVSISISRSRNCAAAW